MIFKYFAYDKTSKNWIDTKLYCTICMPNDQRVRILQPIIYKALMAARLIAIPQDNFHISDSGSFPGISAFTISHLTPTRRTNIGRLTQLPDKKNAANNAKINNSWNELNAFATPKIKLAPPANQFREWIDQAPAWAAEPAPRISRQYIIRNYGDLPGVVNPAEMEQPVNPAIVANEQVAPFIEWDDGEVF